MLAPITAAIFALLALLHFYWALRGISGSSAAIPEIGGKPAFKPTKAVTAAVVLLIRAIGDFRLVGFFQRQTGSPFARLDTLLYSPLCLALGTALALLATG